MAFYALQRWFSKFRTRPFFDWVHWYNEEYKTPEQKELAHQKYKQHMTELLLATTLMNSMLKQ